MKVTIDLDSALVTVDQEGETQQELPLESAEAFDIVTEAWLRAGWDTKYVYSFTWMGRPVIQLPDDMLRIQEVIYSIKPDLIIETGVAHGGSLIFYASLCKAMGRGRVVGIDIEIRPHNRAAIEDHELAEYITLIEGSSVADDVLAAVKSNTKQGETNMVLLDSNHTKEHVMAELDAYADFVSVGSYIVATDGIMEQVVGGPRTQPDWATNNPRQAVLEWVAAHPDFAVQEPIIPFNEGVTSKRVTYWPDAFVTRLR